MNSSRREPGVHRISGHSIPPVVQRLLYALTLPATGEYPIGHSM
jgi:hypothetical protein